MTNPNNHASVIGRLTDDPMIFVNNDGSKKVKFTVMADRNYVGPDNQRAADAIPVEAFVSSETAGNGPYDHVHKGDLVALSLELRQDRYFSKKEGREVFDFKAVITNLSFLESRAITQKRLADRVKAAEQNQAQGQAPVATAASPAPQVAAEPVLVEVPAGVAGVTQAAGMQQSPIIEDPMI